MVKSHYLKTQITEWKVIMRLAGAGYRVIGSLPCLTSNKWKRYQVVLSKPDRHSPPLATEFWLGRDLPLNPYLKGRLVDYVRKKLSVKEFILPPDGLIPDDELELVERTLYYFGLG